MFLSLEEVEKHPLPFPRIWNAVIGKKTLSLDATFSQINLN